MVFSENNVRHSKVLVVGLGRSGTSAIASVLRNCGFLLSESNKLATQEDPELRAYLKDGNIDKFVETLQKRAEKFPLVAYKDPKLFGSYGSDVFHRLGGNWAYVFVFRDPYAIALRNKKSMNLDLDLALEKAISSQKRLFDFYKMVSLVNPVYKISFEKFNTNRREELVQFVSFIGTFGKSKDFIDKLILDLDDDHSRYLKVANKC